MRSRPIRLKARAAIGGCGYCSEGNFEALENRSIDAYVATGRAKDVAGAIKARPPPRGRPPANRRVEAMRAKIKAGAHEPYRLRKQLPERCSGRSTGRGFRQFYCAASKVRRMGHRLHRPQSLAHRRSRPQRDGRRAA
jgi:hypothetical protein